MTTPHVTIVLIVLHCLVIGILCQHSRKFILNRAFLLPVRLRNLDKIKLTCFDLLVIQTTFQNFRVSFVISVSITLTRHAKRAQSDLRAYQSDVLLT